MLAATHTRVNAITLKPKTYILTKKEGNKAINTIAIVFVGIQAG